MIHEQRIYEMTRLAIFEKNHRDQLDGVRMYFRSDYIGRHMIKNGFRITIAFLLVLVGWGLYNSETLIVDITKIDVQALVASILFAYAVALSVFLVITYAVYRVRYERARQDLCEYQERLKKVEFLYKKEEEMARQNAPQRYMEQLREDMIRRRAEQMRSGEIIESRARRDRRSRRG